MTARAGMANLITRLRALTNTTASDYSDDVLQDRLDRTRITHKRIALYALSDYDGGAYSYTEYPLPFENLEEAGTGSGFALRDGVGDDAPSYTVNYAARMITFAADTDNETYYLDCREYDPYAAAAVIWEEKAADVANSVDWKTDNHDLKASQEYQHCLAMAQKMRAQSPQQGGMQAVELFRSDEA